MTGKGWATGSDVRSRPYTKVSQEDWDSIFKRDKKIVQDWEKYQESCEKQREPLNGNRP